MKLFWKNNEKKIYLFFSLFVLLTIIFRYIYIFSFIDKKEYNSALEYSSIFETFIENHTDYYSQKIKNIKNVEQKLELSPFLRNKTIFKNFNNKNKLNININFASNNPMNKEYISNDFEKKYIKEFISNPDKKELFIENNNKYHYLKPIYINNYCASCHSSKKIAPEYIQTKYNSGYGYNVGDIYGIFHLKIDKENIFIMFFNLLNKWFIIDLILFSFMIFIFYKFYYQNNKYIKYLENSFEEIHLNLKNNLMTNLLTNLPNRNNLLEVLKTINKNDKEFTLLILNLNEFKNINEIYGYDVGDKILIKVGQFLKKFFYKNKEYKIFKLSADEFRILFPFKEDIFKVIKKLLKELTLKKFIIDKHEINVTRSVGISSYQERLLQTADLTLKRAKKDVQSILVFDVKKYNQINIKKNIQTLNTLKKAIKNDDIIPFYQPIYNIKTKKIEKYETLARIIDENNQILVPFFFLDIAKKTNTYENITKSIISKSFNHFLHSDLEFSLNVSAIDLRNEEILEYIEHKLSNYPKSKNVVFELLETEEIQDVQLIFDFVKMIKKYDSKIAIDDFGSGYSNFSNLMNFKVDYIKIDGSLVKFINKNENSKIIIKSIVQFSKLMNIQTIAEFVEDEEILNTLREVGVDYAQGYFIGKPDPKLIEN